VLAQVAMHRAQQSRVGTRKLHDYLTREGIVVGRDRLFSLLRERGQLVRRKRRATQTTYSRHHYTTAPNLLKTLTVSAPRQVVVSDITYLRVGRDAFAYLFLVTDLYARKIVGWHVSRDLSHHSALIALTHARHALGNTAGVVHHSDRGSQYCCHEYLAQLAAHHMLASMTDGAHCYQNAVAERVNGILKDEFDLDRVFHSVAEAQHAVAHAVHIYNTVRTHWSLQLQTPHHVFQHAA
jgi:transposase InsO family protein